MGLRERLSPWFEDLYKRLKTTGTGPVILRTPKEMGTGPVMLGVLSPLGNGFYFFLTFTGASLMRASGPGVGSLSAGGR